MRWVDPKYTNEFAVVFSLISFLIPWNVTYGTQKAAYILWIRFPLFQIRRTNLPQVHPVKISTAVGAYQLATSPVNIAFAVWILATILFLVLLAFVGVLYWKETAVESRLPVPPIRVAGGILGCASLALIVTQLLFYTQGAIGTQYPLGVIVPIGFTVFFLTNETDDDAAPVSDPDSPREQWLNN